MADTTIDSQGGTRPEPELIRGTHEPKGVIKKNLKPLIYFGAVLLLIVAAISSGTSKRPPSQQAAAYGKGDGATAQSVWTTPRTMSRTWKNQMAAVRHKDALQVAESTPGDRASGGCDCSPTSRSRDEQFHRANGTVRSRSGLRAAKYVRAAARWASTDFPSGKGSATIGRQRAGTRLQLVICI